MTKLGLCLLASLTLSAGASADLRAQQLNASVTEPTALPDAPTPQLTADAQSSDQTSTSQSSPLDQAQSETPEQRKARAAAELKAEESQRIGGIIPAFNSVINGKAEPLTSGQKFHLFFKSIFDPYQFAIVAVDTGIQEAEDTYPQYHHSYQGLLRNYGAAYADDFDGNLFGNAILPSILHQDPRYYRLGTGTKWHRLLYSVSTTVRCKGDNGKWQPNYSNVFGNLIGGAISNIYYPAVDRGVGLTIDHGLTVSAEGAFGALILEFYPDYEAHHRRKQQEKAARKAAAEGAAKAQDAAPPATAPQQ